MKRTVNHCLNIFAYFVMAAFLVVFIGRKKVQAREAGFTAGSPGGGNYLFTGDYHIPSNHSQNMVETCFDHSNIDHTMKSSSFGTSRRNGEEPNEVDAGVEQIAEGDTANDVLNLIEATKLYIRNEVLVKREYESVREECKNRHELCSFWAHMGECEANPAYMTLQCAPACRTCNKIDIRNRCPLDPDAKNALGPGDLDEMFENIVTHKEFEKFNPIILSRPDNLPEDQKDSAEVHKKSPWMLLFPDFITAEEAERMIELSAAEGYERSMDVGNKNFDGTYGDYESSQRTSENSWCQSVCYENPIAKSIMGRIAEVTGIPEENSEFLQLLRYEQSQFYGVHHDLIPHQLERQSGLRILTFYIYLNDVEEGGETNFPRLGLSVTPKRGSAVLWPSVLSENPDIQDQRTEHQALPVTKGIKYGANAWIHQRDFKGPSARGCS